MIRKFKPVAVMRFSPENGTGYLGTLLRRSAIATETIDIAAGDPVPKEISLFSGLVLMGGVGSVNDESSYSHSTYSLVRSAVNADVPCLGHCFGSQMIAKALGAPVTPNVVKEIGWGSVVSDNNPTAQAWLGAPTRVWNLFQWHRETFGIPQGATRILRGWYCENQAFVVGRTLAIQGHPEVTVDMINTWCNDWQPDPADRYLPSVQGRHAIARETPGLIAFSRLLSDRLYKHWIKGLKSRPET